MRIRLAPVLVVGAFAASVAMPGVAQARAPAHGDFNGDGTSDLAIASPRYPNAEVYSGPGSVNVLYAAAAGEPLLGGRLLSQSTPGILGGSDKRGLFGATMATGDFDGDGTADLAIGAPGHSVRGADGRKLLEAGTVDVVYGSHAGLSTTGAQLWTLATPGVPGRLESARFGSSLAAGDFDGDGRADLAIGVPGLYPDHERQSAIVILYGSRSGLSTHRLQRWTLSTDHVVGSGTSGYIGYELTTGDFDHDGTDDLAFGDFDVSGRHEVSGWVNVLYGRMGVGLTWHGNQRWSEDSAGISGRRQYGDLFGSSLAAGDFDGDRFADLAIGVPGERADTGQVLILYGSGAGLKGHGSQIWDLDSPDVAGRAHDGDQLGAALATGDLDGDGRDELIVGSWRARGDAGEFLVLRGSASGLTGAGSRLWTSDTPGVPGSPTTDAAFGASLLSDDFDADGHDDIATGPAATVHGKPYAGAVDVLFGTSHGLDTARAQRITRATPGVDGPVQSGAQFGVTLQ